MKTTAITLSLGVLLSLNGCIVDLDDDPADMQVLRESRPLENTKELNVDVKFDVGQVELAKTFDDSLFSIDLQYDRRLNPKFSFDAGERAELRLSTDSNRLKKRSNDLMLRLTDKVPIDLEMRMGVSESHLDMTDLQLRRVRLHGGVGETDVTFDRPSKQDMESLEVNSGVGELKIRGLGNTRVRRVDVKGGVGETELDFTGELGSATTDCSVKVGIGEVKLVIPRDADVEIHAQGSFLSNINAPGFDRNGRTYTHHGADSSAKIRIRVESGVGAVNIDLI